jgi:pyruvate formate lyase activating enzyme
MRSEEVLDQNSKQAELVTKLEEGKVRCLACAHRCSLAPGKRGICAVRFNENGELNAPWGYVAGAQVDPIEKKPFSHFLPGSQVLTFGMFGCNFHCEFCQNWHTSQVLKDDHYHPDSMGMQKVTPVDLVDAAVRNQARSIASSYNEPFISTEWAVEIFKLAKTKGLKTAFVSNGFATKEGLDYLLPWLDALKVDLKSMREDQYRRIGGRLQPVLDTIRSAREKGTWVEVVTLVIPGFNDSTEELWEAGRFVASVSPEIPWHVTAYHPDYKMLDAPPTPVETLQRAAEIGQEAGLQYVYAGNIPGRVGSLEDTHCPKCGACVIQRRGYRIIQNQLTQAGGCPNCAQEIAGIWR